MQPFKQAQHRINEVVTAVQLLENAYLQSDLNQDLNSSQLDCCSQKNYLYTLDFHSDVSKG